MSKRIRIRRGALHPQATPLPTPTPAPTDKPVTLAEVGDLLPGAHFLYNGVEYLAGDQTMTGNRRFCFVVSANSEFDFVTLHKDTVVVRIDAP